MSSVDGFEGSLIEKEVRQRQHQRRQPDKIEDKSKEMFFRRRFIRNQFGFMQRVLIILIIITLLFIVQSSITLTPILSLFDPYSYVIVLDAGSTGTRIHVYQFRSSLENNQVQTFILKNEIFEEKKPGLSSFADHVDQAQSQIDQLLEIADKKITRFKHRSTPIVLRATAGLRLLEEEKQKNLLRSVSKSFSSYGFYRPPLDIGIMNETEEGIDAWLTLVYLKGEQFYASRIAALDLGGGSTQITYNPSMSKTSLADKLNLRLKAQQPVEPADLNAFRDKNNRKKNQMPRIDANQAGLEEIDPVKVLRKNRSSDDKQPGRISEEDELMSYMHQFRMFSREINLYSRSYLGYGLMIARETIFTNDTNDRSMVDKNHFRTRCFAKNDQGTFKFQGRTWNVRSQTEIDDQQRFFSCLSTIDSYVAENVRPAIGLDQMSIYVFSYFYDIAQDAGLIHNDPKSTSTITTLFIRDLKQSARNVCSSTNNEHPFLCFDLTYIYSLLTKGYGLDENTPINICKKIQQFEVAWSLGLALKLL